MSLKLDSLFTLTALAALSTAAVPLSAAPAPAASLTAASSPHLLRAKTIELQETFLLYDPTGHFQPLFHNSILIKRPGLVKVTVHTTDPAKKPHLYVADSKAEHEYNAGNNQYQDFPIKPGVKSPSQLRDIAQIDLILNDGPGKPAPDVTRTVTSDTLDGRAMRLITDTAPAPKPGSAVRPTITKTWMDAKTGLLYHWESCYIKAGQIKTSIGLNFSGWKFNPPISAAQLAWARPAGAEPYSEPKLLAVGTPAPDFAVLTPEGKTVHLSDFKGKMLVLDFWATWCGPCQQSMPHLEKVYQQVKDKDVAVLALCVLDKKSDYDKWVTANIGAKYTFPVAFDPAGRGKDNIPNHLYKVVGIPTQYIIDKNGNVAAAYAGYGDGDTRLEDNLRKLGVAIPVPPKTASAK